MNPDEEKQIAYRLARCEQTYLDAKILAEAKSWNGVVNRLYYAAFYAVSALLLKEGISVKTHSSQKSKFNETFLLTERIKRDVGGTYNIFFNYRNDGD